jgi:uncharacterized membrane protein
VWLWFGARDRARVLLKPVTYEIVLGNLVLGTISWLATGSWTTTSLITLTYIGNKLWMFSFYDWVWSHSRWGTVIVPLQPQETGIQSAPDA